MYVDQSTQAMVEVFDNFWFVVTFLMFIVACTIFTVVYVAPVLLYEYIVVPVFYFFFGHLL